VITADIAETQDNEQRQKRQYVGQLSRVNLLGALLIVLPILAVLTFPNPVEGIAFGVLISSILIVLLSLLQLRVDRKYKQVTANFKDYFISNVWLYILALVPGLFLLGYNYALPRFGINFTVLWVDSLILLMYLFLARFPIALRLGNRASPITQGNLFSTFSELAKRMGVSHVDLYSIDWKKFKVANAFQAGPSKFSVFVSNYLLENMTEDETNAVLAHELAHAKKRHVAKFLALLLGTLMVSLDLLVIGGSLAQSTIWGVIPFAIGFGSAFVVPRLDFRVMRKFELEADEISARTMGDPKSLISALEKLRELNLIPDSTKSITHPPIAKRIQILERAVPGDL
jgi:Zn-dependent protease with chaperone function